jgi:uncharacterized protein
MIEMIVSRVGVDHAGNTFIVVLRERDGLRVLPIWIGQAEAEAIVMELQSVAHERPMTHDLITQILVGVRATARRVNILRVERGTYFAELQLESSGAVVTIDARPSDSIAIALRTGAPIFAADDLLVSLDDGDLLVPPPATPDGERSSGTEMTADELKAYLQRLRPEDLGKFMP